MTLLLTATAWADSAPRVAVVSDEASRDIAAVLTTELSSRSSITLVERDQLAQIGDEAKVQQMAGSDATALGKLLGADGLIFLDQRADGPHVRFTAVNLGYALFDDPLPAAGSPQQEAKALAHLIENDAPKLELTPSKALPISVLNLRADFGTPESLRLERDLTLLLESKLAAVPEFVVLERRHAWSLNFEHSLSPDANPVLRGACLVDGNFDLNGDTCTMSLRVRKPGDETAQPITLEGKAGDKEALADNLVAAIKKALGRDVAEAPGAGAAEAGEYLAEALWAWRVHVPDAALEAADSAELLGAPPEDVLPLRIQILCDVANSGMERWLPPFGQQAPTLDPAALAQKVETLKRAIADTALYRDEKLEAKLGQFVPSNGAERFSFRTGETVARVAVPLLQNAVPARPERLTAGEGPADRSAKDHRVRSPARPRGRRVIEFHGEQCQCRRCLLRQLGAKPRGGNRLVAPQMRRFHAGPSALLHQRSGPAFLRAIFSEPRRAREKLRCVRRIAEG
ncbi:MAG: CsgG/HfaB family protein [Verrucomicrobiota bacterium]